MESHELESILELLDEAAKSTTDKFTKGATANDAEFESILQDMKDIAGDVHDTPAIRKVKEQDEECGVPMAMYWTTRQMANWIEEIGFPYYRVMNQLSQLKRLWYFSSSVNSFFKRACASIEWGQISDFWSDPSSTSILHVFEQRRLWRDCADAQARLRLRWSHMWLVP